MPITMSDGTVLRSHKCPECKTALCATVGYGYYCPNKECPRFDLVVRSIVDRDVLRTGRRPPAKPRAYVGTGNDVTKRAESCRWCNETTYIITTDMATLTVCKCGVVVRGN